MTFDTVVHTETVTKYMRDGVLHRDDDLPAVIHKDGSREWWVHGKRLRWDPRNPTELRCDPSTGNYEVSATRIWHNIDGEIHRDSGPAVIHFNGTKEWWKHGERYRDNGLPTVETPGGMKMWHNRQGQLHREGLPALIGPGGPEWWLHGIRQEAPS